jgi:small conductance mechanosensitive channel
MEAYLKQLLVAYIPNVLMALALLVIGLLLIKIAVKTTQNILKNSNTDSTLQIFLCSLVRWLLKIILFVSVIAQLDIQTTSFAAILAAAGLAIGLALQGSLANFAGGVLIILLKPIKIGDFIETQGLSGTLK